MTNSSHPSLSPAEPRQALGLLSSIALSSWRVRAIYSLTKTKDKDFHLHEIIYTPQPPNAAAHALCNAKYHPRRFGSQQKRLVRQ